MIVDNVLIHCLLCIYLCYCHDLSHADQGIVKQQSEASNIDDPGSENIDTTIPNRADDEILVTSNKIVEETNGNDQHNHDDVQGQYTTPSVDISLPQDQVPILADDDLIQLTKTSTDSDRIISQTDASTINTDTYIANPKIIYQDDLSSETKLNDKESVETISHQGSSTSTNDDTTTDSQQSDTKPSSHPRINQRFIENELKIDDNVWDNKVSLKSMDEDNNSTNQLTSQIEPRTGDPFNLAAILSNKNNSELFTNKTRHICWVLPEHFQTSIILLENQMFRIVDLLPDFTQTILFGHTDNREVLMNTIWCISTCVMCFIFSLCFLSMATKRLKQSKYEKDVRVLCQKLQQHNNQIELERSAFERQNQKLSDEVDELKLTPLRDADEDIFTLREECMRFQEDLNVVQTERTHLQQQVHHQHQLMAKQNHDLQQQTGTIAHLNNEVHQLKQELDKQRALVNRLESNDISVERFQQSQQMIEKLQSDLLQLRQENSTNENHLKQHEKHANQLTIENYELIQKMQQLRDLFEKHDQIIKRIQGKIIQDKAIKFEELVSILSENSSKNNQSLLSAVDNDINKSRQQIRDLQNQIDLKNRRIKELDACFKQEQDHSKELETKLKLILELRERDTHVPVRQLGYTDAELRKARTDTERIHILQEHLQFKQQQLDDLQKVLSTEQNKFNEECIKLQHDTHERWMEVKRLSRELEASKKECENLRRQITKYANTERSLPNEKTTLNKSQGHNKSKALIDKNEVQETNSSSTQYHDGDNSRSSHSQHLDSGGASPTEIHMLRSTIYPLPPRPPFYPPPFMPPPQPLAFMMRPRFQMTPTTHLMNSGGADAYADTIDASRTHDSVIHETVEQTVTTDLGDTIVKPRKLKKSLKKPTKTSDGSLIKETL